MSDDPVLPVSAELLYSEVESAEAVLAKWKKAIGEGIPGVDIPSTEEALYRFIAQLCGELMVVAGKCQNLAAVVSDRGLGG